MTELQLRLFALQRAIEIEGPKALTPDVLAAAQEILDFLMSLQGDAEATRH